MNKLNFETFSLRRLSLGFFFLFFFFTILTASAELSSRVTPKYHAFSLSCMHITVGKRVLLLLPTLGFSASHVPFISNEYICWLHIMSLSGC